MVKKRTGHLKCTRDARFFATGRQSSVRSMTMCLESSADLAWRRCSGVVQLFNAVRQQQGEVQSRLQEAGGSLRRTETALQAVSRHSFLQRLRDGADAETPPPQQVSSRPIGTCGYRTGCSEIGRWCVPRQIGSAVTRCRHRTRALPWGQNRRCAYDFFPFAWNNRVMCLNSLCNVNSISSFRTSW